MQSPVFFERRMFERILINLSIKYWRLRSNDNGSAHTHDISAKGMGIVIGRRLQANATLKIWVHLHDKDEPLYIKGRVIWSRRLSKDRYIAGVNLENAGLMVPLVLQC